MPCPTCNATLQNLGLDQVGRRTFWCPNCGTLKWERVLTAGDTPTETFVLEEVDVPAGVRILAERGPMSGAFDAWELEFTERNNRIRQGA